MLGFLLTLKNILHLFAIALGLLTSGCIAFRPAGTTDLSDLTRWEHVKYRKLGIEIEAPKDRREEEVVHIDTSDPFYAYNNTGVSFVLHQAAAGFLQEPAFGVFVCIEVLSKEEWSHILKGERGSRLGGHFDEYDHKFCPRLIQRRGFRKDTMSRDGRVVMASAIRSAPYIDENSPEAKEDKAAIKRILESVRFLD